MTGIEYKSWFFVLSQPYPEGSGGAESQLTMPENSKHGTISNIQYKISNQEEIATVVPSPRDSFAMTGEYQNVITIHGRLSSLAMTEYYHKVIANRMQ